MMSTVVKRVVTSFGFKTKWSRYQSAAFRVLVDRNGKQSYPVMNIEALAFQKRFESEAVASPMTLSNHLSSEIASEEDSAPSEEFKSIVNLIEKTFKIHDEPGRGESIRIDIKDADNFTLLPLTHLFYF